MSDFDQAVEVLRRIHNGEEWRWRENSHLKWRSGYPSITHMFMDGHWKDIEFRPKTVTVEVPVPTEAFDLHMQGCGVIFANQADMEAFKAAMREVME